MDGITVWAVSSIAVLSIPTIVLLYYGFIVYRQAQGFSGTVLVSISLTLFSSAAAAASLFLIFTPLAFHLSRRRSDILETAADLPAFIPHPIVGISLLLLDSPITPSGRFLQSIGINFFYSIQGLVAALIIVAAPVYIRSVQSYFSGMSPDSELFAYSLGASRLRVLFSIVIPASSRDLLSSALTAMGRAMSEFGSVAIVAYYVLQAPFSGVKPASVLVNEYYAGYYGPSVAISASAFMILFSIALMIAVRLVRRRKGTVTRML